MNKQMKKKIYNTLRQAFQVLYFQVQIITTFLLVIFIENDMTIPGIVWILYILSTVLCFGKVIYVTRQNRHD